MEGLPACSHTDFPALLFKIKNGQTSQLGISAADPAGCFLLPPVPVSPIAKENRWLGRVARKVGIQTTAFPQHELTISQLESLQLALL